MIRRILLLLAAVAFAVTVAPVAAAADDVVKVAVVRSTGQNGGEPDSLAQVARRTLGDPGRAGEIFALNRGRAQADGGALTDPATLRPGWILRLPDDATGPDVRLGRIGVAAKPFLTWKVVLALIGAVVLAALTLLVVFRRRIVRWVRARIRDAGEKSRLRRRIRERAELRATLAAAFADDRRAADLAQRSVVELDGQGVEAYAIKIGKREVTAWVTAAGPPLAPWRGTGETVWTRPVDGPFAPAGPTPIVPCPAPVGGDDDGVLFADLTWLDGVLAIGGDPRVAADALVHLLAGLARSRPDLRVLGVVDGPAMPSQALRPRSVAELPPRPGGPAAPDGTVLLAARRRGLAGLVVMSVAPVGDDAARLFAFCGPGGDHVAIVVGDLPGAHWQWTADPDGTLHVPILGVTVTVPSVRRI